MPRNVHVVPNKAKDSWDVTRPNAQRVTDRCNTQAEAIDRARTISQKDGVELIIHGRDGQIRAKDSHGKDPRHIKG